MKQQSPPPLPGHADRPLLLKRIFTTVIVTYATASILLLLFANVYHLLEFFYVKFSRYVGSPGSAGRAIQLDIPSLALAPIVLCAYLAVVIAACGRASSRRHLALAGALGFAVAGKYVISKVHRPTIDYPAVGSESWWYTADAVAIIFVLVLLYSNRKARGS